MTCHETERRLPGYLDGAIASGEHVVVREHLDSCEKCREHLEDYRRLAVCLANVEPVLAPPGLAVRIRVQASNLGPARAKIRRVWAHALLAFKNILEPLAVPATGGLLTALVVFVLVVQNILVGIPLGPSPNDLPLSFVPASLESLASFPVPGIAAADGQPDSGVLLLEATVDSRGQVVSYRILSGPNNAAVQRQVYQVLLFSRFRPQLSFGLPTSGGHVLLRFSEVRIRG